MTGIESIMHRDVVTIEADQSAMLAARTMREHNLGALVVMNGGRIHGILSERDLMNRVVAEGLDPSTVAVESVCTREVTTVEASATVTECYDLIMQKGFRHLPIRDEANRPVGIISARDFLRCLIVEVDSEVTIEATCAKLGQLTELMARMEEHR